jgi:hypothetical protein
VPFRAEAALLIILVLSGCQSQPVIVDDAAITTTIKAKLGAEFGPIERRQERQFERGADQQTVSFIEVQSTNGVVVLRGEVRSLKAKARAAEIAKSVPHVASVENRLAVAPQYSDDAVGTSR